MNAPHPPAPPDVVAQLDADAARTLARATSRGIVSADREGRVRWVNDGFTRMTGFTLAEVVGRRPGSFLHGKDTDPDTVRHMRACLTHGVPFDIEVLNYRKGGGPFWARVEVLPVRDATGNVTGYVSLHTDVTLRREAQRRLERGGGDSRELAFIANRIPGPVSIEQPDGTLLWVNRGWSRCYGYPPSEALGRRITDLLDGKATDASVRAAMQAAVLRGETMRAELVEYTRERVERRMLLERQPVTDALGKVIRVVCLAHEIAPHHVDPTQAPAALRHTAADLEDDLVWAGLQDGPSR